MLAQLLQVYFIQKTDLWIKVGILIRFEISKSIKKGAGLLVLNIQLNMLYKRSRLKLETRLSKPEKPGSLSLKSQHRPVNCSSAGEDLRRCHANKQLGFHLAY